MLDILVTGGRDFHDRDLLEQVLDVLEPYCVIHGGAPGADTLANEWAGKNGAAVEEYPAEWEVHGKVAGPIRNQVMLDKSQPDLVVAFPGGNGTEDMVRRARRAGYVVLRVEP